MVVLWIEQGCAILLEATKETETIKKKKKKKKCVVPAACSGVLGMFFTVIAAL